MSDREGSVQNQILEWTEADVQSGSRTRDLIENEPNIGKLRPIKVLEHIIPGSNHGIVIFPGGMDFSRFDEVLEYGYRNNVSVFQVRYDHEDSSFSLRGEVAQMADHIDARDIRECDILTGSWGGLPAMRMIYDLTRGGKIKIRSFSSVSAALQPSGFRRIVRLGGGILGPFLTLRRGLPDSTIMAPLRDNRQFSARIRAVGLGDFEYSDSETLGKIASIPALFFVPPGGKDWWVDSIPNYMKYFPKGRIIVYPAYKNLKEKVTTVGGHFAVHALRGLQDLEDQFLADPGKELQLPQGFYYFDDTARSLEI